MNKKIREYVFFCFVTIGIVGALFVSVYTFKRVNDQSASRDDGQLLYLSYMNQLYLSIIDDSTPINNLLIKEYLHKWDLSTEPVLIINYSTFSCKSCMDFLLHGLEKVFPNYASNSQILFVASGYKTEPQRKYGNTVYLSYGENMDLDSEESNEPFLLMCIEGRVFHVFTPSSSYEELYETYLTAVKDKYFTGKN